MGLDLEYIDDQTSIDEDEKEGLLIETISTKGELDEFEQQNIEEAMQWVFGRKFKAKDVFTEKFICNYNPQNEMYTFLKRNVHFYALFVFVQPVAVLV